MITVGIKDKANSNEQGPHGRSSIRNERKGNANNRHQPNDHRNIDGDIQKDSTAKAYGNQPTENTMAAIAKIYAGYDGNKIANQ